MNEYIKPRGSIFTISNAVPKLTVITVARCLLCQYCAGTDNVRCMHGPVTTLSLRLLASHSSRTQDCCPLCRHCAPSVSPMVLPGHTRHNPWEQWLMLETRDAVFCQLLNCVWLILSLLSIFNKWRNSSKRFIQIQKCIAEPYYLLINDQYPSRVVPSRYWTF